MHIQMERLYEAAKKLKGISGQSELARALNVSPQTVNNWEARGVSKQGLVTAQQSLGCDAVWVETGVGSMEFRSSILRNDSNVSFKQEHVPRGRYPLISWVSAGVFSEAVEPYNRDEIETWHETTVASSGNSFWLEVKGDSMTAPVGLSIPEGMIILVDPEVPPTNGKLVVARIEGQNEATFKRLVVDAGRAFLKPLNPQYPMLEIADDCKIVGVVVDAKLARLP